MFHFDRERFFDGFRQTFGPLTQQQVDGLEFLLGRLEQDERLTDVRVVAYLLATTKWETAHTFQPINEFGSNERFERLYGPTTAVGKRLGNTRTGDGVRFHGRGYVQLTGRNNYVWAKIVDRPEAALERATAYEVLVRGMLGGQFGRRLGAFIKPGEVPDYEGARQSVNGHDQAGKIADIARRIEAVLRASGGIDAGAERAAPPRTRSRMRPATRRRTAQ